MKGLDVMEVLKFMADYTRRTGYPVPAPPGFASKWSEGLKLRGEGSPRLLFTGALYQLMPYIGSTVRLLELAETRGLSSALEVIRYLAERRPWALAGLVRPEKEEVDEANRTLRSIASLLQSSGVDFSYVPWVSDLYSGALLLDYGIIDALEEHAERVSRAIESTGAEEVITVDPHTTLTLKAYRRLTGLSVKVTSYLELVRPAGSWSGRATVHDSCIYARDLNMSDALRGLLVKAGVQISEARRHGVRTSCCGGPIEALSPSTSIRIAKARASELLEASGTVITMCPICRANLRRAGISRIIDISLVLLGHNIKELSA